MEKRVATVVLTHCGRTCPWFVTKSFKQHGCILLIKKDIMFFSEVDLVDIDREVFPKNCPLEPYKEELITNKKVTPNGE